MERTTTTVRMTMHTERYAIAASLFADIYGDEELLPTPVSSAEEMLMGIFADPGLDGVDDDPADAYFVKPADPAVLRAKSTGKKTDAIEELDFYTEATMTVIPDSDAEDSPATVAILYHESELTGMDGATSTITYRTDDPELLTMLRSGSVKTAMTFRPHHRAICTYDTPYMPFQVAIHALTVDNRIHTESGILVLDYLIEIKGGVAERCTMRIRVDEV